MSTNVSISIAPALLQRIQASSEYGEHVKHDWESKSFEKFFEAVKPPGDSADDIPRFDRAPGLRPAQSPNFAANGSRASGDGLLPGESGHAGPSAGSNLRAVAQYAADGGTSEVFGSIGPVIPTAPRSSQIEASGGEVEFDETVDVTGSQLSSSANGPETNAAAATPVRAAVIIGLSTWGAHVLIRSPDVGAAEANRLRYAFASALGWSGISLASFKLNGQNSDPFPGSAERSRFTHDTASASQSEFQIRGGENP